MRTQLDSADHGRLRFRPQREWAGVLSSPAIERHGASLLVLVERGAAPPRLWRGSQLVTRTGPRREQSHLPRFPPLCLRRVLAPMKESG
jgi:hypothetical protein